MLLGVVYLIIKVSVYTKFCSFSSRVAEEQLTSMTITGGPIIKDECLTVRGKVVLTGVPENIVITSASSSSAFLGAKSMTISSHHVFNLGVLDE